MKQMASKTNQLTQVQRFQMLLDLKALIEVRSSIRKVHLY